LAQLQLGEDGFLGDCAEFALWDGIQFVGLVDFYGVDEGRFVDSALQVVVFGHGLSELVELERQ
jgi:hypothetical protein